MSESDNKIFNMEMRIIKLSSDTEHIKNRLDNGISQTLTKVYDKINQMYPEVNENTSFRRIMIKGLIYVSCVSVLGGLIAMAFYLIRNLTIRG